MYEKIAKFQSKRKKKNYIEQDLDMITELGQTAECVFKESPQ